jgi:uncharacterized delta-60 repeat protein
VNARKHSSRGKIARAIEALEGRMLLSITLDPNFGSGGIVAPNEGSNAQVTLALPGNKTLVVGGDFLERYNANGSHDATFGRNGVVNMNDSYFFQKAANAALAPGGKIVVLLNVEDSFDGQSDVIYRFNGDGSLDTTFAAYGIVLANTWNAALAVQSNGEVIFAGSTGVTRYRSNGTIDTAFGSSGTTHLDMDVNAIALRPDGRILVGGANSSHGYSVLQLNSSGQLDPNFAAFGAVNQLAILPNGEVLAANENKLTLCTTTGALDQSFGNHGTLIAPNTIASLQPLSSGKILVMTANGIINNDISPNGSPRLTRYTAMGGLDSSFGTGGTVKITPIGSQAGAWLRPCGLILQNGGIVVAATRTFNGNNPAPVLYRYTINGAVDSSFGTGGQAAPATPAVFGEFVDDVVLGDGDILAAGDVLDSSGQQALYLARYLPTGAFDTSFGTNGRVISHVGGFNLATQIALEPDGSFVVRATTGAVGEENDLPAQPTGIVRFTSSGGLFTSFGTGGIIHVPNNVTRFALLPDGKIVTLGSNTVSPDQGKTFAAPEIRRYKPNGTLDSTFGVGGRVTSFPSGGAIVAFQLKDIALQGTKIIVVGDGGNSEPGSSIAVERLTSGGTIDPSFGVNGFNLFPVDQDEIYTLRAAVAADGSIDVTGDDDGAPDVITAIISADGTGAAPYDNRTGSAGGVAARNNGQILIAYSPYQSAVHNTGTVVEDLNDDIPELQVSAEVFDVYPKSMALAPDGSAVVAGIRAGRPVLLRFRVSDVATLSYSSVSATDGNDTITVTQSGAAVTVVVNGQNLGGFTTYPGRSFSVYGLDGNDTITINTTTQHVAVFGGNGNDTLRSINGNNSLDGGGGNDALTGGTGANTLMGGAGDDLLRPGTGPTNDIFGGTGLDAVDYSQRTHGMEIHLDGLRDSGMSGEHDLIGTDVERVYGSQGNDTIFGNFNNIKNALYGLGGNDTIYAGNGSDAIYGGDGNDSLFARNSVADYLDGGAGFDTAHIDTLDKTVSIESFLA